MTALDELELGAFADLSDRATPRETAAEWAPPCAAAPGLFFPPEDDLPLARLGPAGRRQVEQARALCQACPLRRGCLRWALEHGEVGVWGGTTTWERRAARTGRAGAAG